MEKSFTVLRPARFQVSDRAAYKQELVYYGNATDATKTVPAGVGLVRGVPFDGSRCGHYP